VTFIVGARGKIVAILVFAVLIVGPVAYVYETQGLSNENVATGDGYVLVLTVHPNAGPNRDYCTIRVKRGDPNAIRWIYVEGNSLARNITGYVEENVPTRSVTGEGGESVFGFSERLWRDGDRVHLLLNIRGKVVDLGTIVVRTSSLQADDYALLAAYVLMLTVIAVLVFPRSSAFLNIVTSRAPSPGVSSACLMYYASSSLRLFYESVHAIIRI
jgi:hypothetical protein